MCSGLYFLPCMTDVVFRQKSVLFLLEYVVGLSHYGNCGCAIGYGALVALPASVSHKPQNSSLLKTRTPHFGGDGLSFLEFGHYLNKSKSPILPSPQITETTATDTTTPAAMQRSHSYKLSLFMSISIIVPHLKLPLYIILLLGWGSLREGKRMSAFLLLWFLVGIAESDGAYHSTTISLYWTPKASRIFIQVSHILCHSKFYTQKQSSQGQQYQRHNGVLPAILGQWTSGNSTYKEHKCYRDK